jgi:hypothetical protein
VSNVCELRQITYCNSIIQCLGITCDNASNNDTFIEELVDLLPNFPGAANCCQCFLHIVNLIAKTLLKQYDVPKKKAEEALDEAEQELLELAQDLDLEEATTMVENGLSGNSEENDDVEGWVDEMAKLTEEERAELRENL